MVLYQREKKEKKRKIMAGWLTHKIETRKWEVENTGGMVGSQQDSLRISLKCWNMLVSKGVPWVAKYQHWDRWPGFCHLGIWNPNSWESQRLKTRLNCYMLKSKSVDRTSVYSGMSPKFLPALMQSFDELM